MKIKTKRPLGRPDVEHINKTESEDKMKNIIIVILLICICVISSKYNDLQDKHMSLLQAIEEEIL